MSKADLLKLSYQQSCRKGSVFGIVLFQIVKRELDI